MMWDGKLQKESIIVIYSAQGYRLMTFSLSYYITLYDDERRTTKDLRIILSLSSSHSFILNWLIVKYVRINT